MMPKLDLIAELKKRQVKSSVEEGKDGILEDIIKEIVIRNTTEFHSRVQVTFSLYNK